MSKPSGNWSSWVTKAEHDLLCIRNNLAAAEVPWDTVCFHAQQVAEKMLKAFLVYHGVQPAKTHDLYALLGECAVFDSAILELRESCRLLNPFSVDIRYPEPFPEPDESEARDAVSAADEVYRAILPRFSPPECDDEDSSAPEENHREASEPQDEQKTTDSSS